MFFHHIYFSMASCKAGLTGMAMALLMLMSRSLRICRMMAPVLMQQPARPIGSGPVWPGGAGRSARQRPTNTQGISSQWPAFLRRWHHVATGPSPPSSVRTRGHQPRQPAPEDSGKRTRRPGDPADLPAAGALFPAIRGLPTPRKNRSPGSGSTTAGSYDGTPSMLSRDWISAGSKKMLNCLLDESLIGARGRIQKDGNLL